MTKLREIFDTLIASFSIGFGVGLGILIVTQFIGHISISIVVN